MRFGRSRLFLLGNLFGLLLLGAGRLGGAWAAAPLPVTSGMVLPRSGQITAYDGAGKVRNFEGSGQDGEFQKGLPWPEPRFVNNGDGTVTDRLSGLMWLKDGGCLGSADWGGGLERVAALNRKPREAGCLDYHANYTDWTLPNLNELASLLNAEAAVPAAWLNGQSFINIAEQGYWSASSYQNRFNAWTVTFDQGEIGYQPKISTLRVLPVRQVGGAVAPPLPMGSGMISGGVGAGEGSAPKASGPRFQENGDGTVTDQMTGLMWLADGGCLPAREWSAALAEVREFNQNPGPSGCQGYRGGFQDWALPNAVELRSLVDYGTDYPALVTGQPFLRLDTVYWSSTTAPSQPQAAVGVNFQQGAMSFIPKEEKHGLWLVRNAKPTPLLPRLTGAKDERAALLGSYQLVADSLAQNTIVWPPSPRFVDLGDGTSLDIVTSLIWLTDANCLGKHPWSEAKKKVDSFNAKREAFQCEGYTASFDDWQLPTREQILSVMPQGVKDGVAWLASEGIEQVKGTADYWTATPNPINLYYAEAVNLKRMVSRDYPISLRFYLWPVRRPAAKPAEPVISLAVNGQEEKLVLTAKDPLIIKLFLHTFGRRVPASYWLWYDTPAGSLWLSPSRKWRPVKTPIYQGDLFNLMNYEVFRSVATGLEEGEYTYHFAVELNPGGKKEQKVYETKVMVTVPGPAPAGAPDQPPPAAAPGKP